MTRLGACKLCLLVPVVLGSFYVGGALILFDTSSPAYAFDEETRNGRAVAIGPHPREVFTKPTHQNIHFGGNEWPFAIYRPVRWAWCKVKGFEQAQAR